MKNPKFPPLAFLALAILFVTGCTAEPVEVEEDQAEEPVVVEEVVVEEEEELVRKDYVTEDGLVVTPFCQDKCFDQWMDNDMIPSDYDFDTCYLACEAIEGNL